jgi:hypothetical protein
VACQPPIFFVQLCRGLNDNGHIAHINSKALAFERLYALAAYLGHQPLHRPCLQEAGWSHKINWKGQDVPNPGLSAHVRCAATIPVHAPKQVARQLHRAGRLGRHHVHHGAPAHPLLFHDCRQTSSA